MLYSPSAGSAIVTVMNDTPSVTASEPVRSDRSDRSASPTRRPSHRASRRTVAITSILASTVVVSLFVNGPSASAATNAQAPDIVAGANTRLRFAGSNIQCVVAANENSVAFDLDCFVDSGFQGQFGSYHVAIDGDNQTRVIRTTITGPGMPGGMGNWIWSDPEKQHGETSYVESKMTSVPLGNTVRIGSTDLYCLYQVSDIIDKGARGVACMYAKRSGSAVASTDELFRTTPSAAPGPRHAIFVSNRVAAVLALRDGAQPEVLFRRRHFS